MSSTAAEEVFASPSDKPKRWDFSRDAVTPGRLVAWGSEAAVAATLVAPLADIPWQAGTAAGLLCATTATIYEQARGSWLRVTTTRAATWLSMTGWMSYTIHAGPTILTMVFGGALWAAGAAANISMDKWGEETQAAEKELASRLEQAKEIEKTQSGWAKLFYDICGIEGVVVDPLVDKWASGAGETIKATLPRQLNVSSLRGYESAFAGELGLPKGGGVSFNSGGPDTARNVVYVAITRKNMMAGAIPYPTLAPTTINKKVVFGRLPDGSDAALNMKDEGLFAVGAQGSGKTGLMAAISLGLIRCVDVIIVDLDTSGKLSAAFVSPWIRHGIGVPLIDWPATTEEECLVAVEAGKAAIIARKTMYADLLEDEEVDNLPARPDLPAIIFRVDETKSMPDEVKAGIDFIINEGRSVNVRASGTGLSATRDYISKAMDELTPGRIGLRTNNASELMMLFPGFGAPDMDLLTDPGSVLYMSASKGPFEPTPAKVFATMAEAFDEDSKEREWTLALKENAARQLSDIRPNMDQITSDAMGPAWTQRWARIIPNLRGDAHGNVDSTRMHPTVWELYQSWDTPESYPVLLGYAYDEEGELISPTGARAADIPRGPSEILDEEAIQMAATQMAAIEMAAAAPDVKSNDELTVELFASIGRPAKPSEIYPLMKRAGYTLSERTFRDACKNLASIGKLDSQNGLYQVPGGTDGAGDAGSHDADGSGDGTDH